MHLRVGWWSLLLFLTLGLILETLHGFKVVASTWTSPTARAVSCGPSPTLTGPSFPILNLVFAVSIRVMPEWEGSSRTLASRCLLGALFLMPLGFFLGGVFIYGGDPGLNVMLVPPGALLLFLAVLLTARASRGISQVEPVSLPEGLGRGLACGHPARKHGTFPASGSGATPLLDKLARAASRVTPPPTFCVQADRPTLVIDPRPSYFAGDGGDTVCASGHEVPKSSRSCQNRQRGDSVRL